MKKPVISEDLFNRFMKHIMETDFDDLVIPEGYVLKEKTIKKLNTLIEQECLVSKTQKYSYFGYEKILEKTQRSKKRVFENEIENLLIIMNEKPQTISSLFAICVEPKRFQIMEGV